MVSKVIKTESMDELMKLFGSFDENIKAICAAFDVRVVPENGQSSLFGEEANVDSALAVIDKLRGFIYGGDPVDVGRVNYLCECQKEGLLDDVDELLNDVVAITSRANPSRAKPSGKKSTWT